VLAKPVASVSSVSVRKTNRFVDMRGTVILLSCLKKFTVQCKSISVNLAQAN